MDIQFKRGVEANRASITPKLGEPIFTTDGKELFIGDGSTAGGIPIGNLKADGTPTEGQLAVFKGASGKLLEGLDKATLLSGYATTQSVTETINTTVPGIKVNSATEADSAKDADKLNGRSDYLTDDVLTNSYQENDAAKVTSAAGVYALWQLLSTGKINVSDITASLNDSSTTKVLSALGAKTLKAAVDAAQSSANTALTNANAAKAVADSNKLKLDRLPNQITKGTTDPVNGTGTDGDIYLQYK